MYGVVSDMGLNWCECDTEEREIVSTLPWQYDLCRQCGEDIPDSKERPPAR